MRKHRRRLKGASCCGGQVDGPLRRLVLEGGGSRIHRRTRRLVVVVVKRAPWREFRHSESRRPVSLGPRSALCLGILLSRIFATACCRESCCHVDGRGIKRETTDSPQRCSADATQFNSSNKKRYGLHASRGQILSPKAHSARCSPKSTQQTRPPALSTAEHTRTQPPPTQMRGCTVLVLEYSLLRYSCIYTAGSTTSSRTFHSSMLHGPV